MNSNRPIGRWLAPLAATGALLAVAGFGVIVAGGHADVFLSGPASVFVMFAVFFGVITWLVGPGQPHNPVVRMMALSAVVSQKLLPFLASFTKDDLEALNEMVADGRIRTVIDREFPLGQAQDALWHQGEGHAQGKSVIITPAGEKETL